MRGAGELRSSLRRIDGRPYGAYRELTGSWRLPELLLTVERVQPDPFAPPSRIRVRIPREAAGIPLELLRGRARRLALEDWLLRRLADSLRRASRRRGTGGSGLFRTVELSPAVLERTALRVTEEAVEARFFAGLPARGRRVDGGAAEEMLLGDLPRAVTRALCLPALPADLWEHVHAVEDAEHIRARLAELDLVAFVADGSVLPRESGTSERPLRGALPFSSPPELAVEVDTPHRGRVRGMGVPRGVVLIVGGGYHGKSTLLRALALGVYPHVPGDGRELVVADPATVFVRAEDGRPVEGVDISAFISELPDGTDTRSFSTRNASGSTSQAAAIVEALEAGARVLLFDEDTSATNLLIRDRRMQELVHKSREPITPLLDRIRPLFRSLGVSSVMVMGGSGDYLDVAHRVILMDAYRALDVTERAREVARRFPTGRRPEASPEEFPPVPPRRPWGVDLGGKVRAEEDWLSFGHEEVDLTRVHQIVEIGQVRAIGAILQGLFERSLRGERTLGEVLDELESLMDREGLEAAVRSSAGSFSRPRRFEIAAALNRLPSLRVRTGADGGAAGGRT